MNEKQFKELMEKLNLLVKLVVMNVIKDRENKEQIRLLSSFGFRPKKIAEFLGKTPHEIRMILYRMRKKK